MLTIVLRFAHVVFGALWVGMMTYQVFFLMPALSEAGPDSGKVMAALARRRVPVILPLIALIAIISGAWLLMRLMGGDAAGLMQIPMGKAYAWGGTAAILAFVLGLAFVRPAMMKAMRLAESGGPAAEIARLRARSAAMGRVVTVLLLIALTLMAVARYL